MSTPRNALGRGLGALISSAPSTAPDTTARQVPATENGGSIDIPVDSIDPNPEQPRRHFAPEQLQELADSITAHGVLQPIVVRRAGTRYELVMGERRWRASRVAGRTHVPAVIADVAPQDRLSLAIVENVQRHDLNPIELALAYRALLEAGATQEEIGERVSKNRSSIANHLRLLDLSRDLQEDVEVGRLSMGHAKALLQVSNPERRLHLRNRVVNEQLSVRETEQLGREIAGPARKRKDTAPTRTADPNMQRLADQLQRHLQTRVRLHGDAKRGRIEVEYYSGEDLDRLSSLLLESA